MPQNQIDNITLSCKGKEVYGPRSPEKVEGAQEYNIMSPEPVPFNEDGVIYYHLANRSYDLTEEEHVVMLSKVFAEMNYFIHPLRCLPTSDIEKAYFKIYFVDKDAYCKKDGEKLFKCPYKFSKNTLAVQYAHYGSRRGGKFRRGKWAGYCFINDKFFFQLKDDPKVKAKNIVNILVHEVVGHGLNIGHTDVLGDIMGPIYDPNNTFGPDSCQAINELYSPLKYDFFPKKYSTKFFYRDYLSGSKPAPKKPRRKTSGGMVRALVTKIFN